eukprot:TRINITY_DN81949_c0_g1_i1.p1 TRINITY_DN81949_c0_g1~~TRINITY_DN81949_c0_g1_i1.p1  ORF type:complete len:425 (-),score=40.91 TRINITY_DN81949_c0_g1_i1:253-1377(-)
MNAGDDQFIWSPQDLTKDARGNLLPDTDYIRMYQAKPALWPIEFFLILWRRRTNKKTNKKETQILVRESSNGTADWGIGTGVPATRWMLSTQVEPPPGYKRRQPNLTFAAHNFPEFPAGIQSWHYDKIDIDADVFGKSSEFHDPDLSMYATEIQTGLKTRLSSLLDSTDVDPWTKATIPLISKAVEEGNSIAAIQGSLRMSGLFSRKKPCENQETSATPGESPRYVDLKQVPASKLVESLKVYTMFPQMPQRLQKDPVSADEIKSSRSLLSDSYGRVFTHKSTSNVSNTIHGVYLTLDATDLNLDRDSADNAASEIPAFNLLGTEEIPRYWKSLEALKVLHSDGSLGTEDTKPTFISGFIVRQLVKEEVIYCPH